MLKTIGYAICLPPLLLTSPTRAGDPPSPRHLLVRVSTQPEEIQDLYDLGLDVWDFGANGRRVDMRVSTEELERLRVMGFDPIVLNPDVYAMANTSTSAVASVDEPWSAYHTLTATNQFMFDLVATYPQRAALLTIGTSCEGRPIYGLGISASVAVEHLDRPAFFIVGGHHAREWISVEVSLYAAERLVVDYDRSARIRRLLNIGKVWIVPVLNVDGFEYSQTTDRLWRLNRHDFGSAIGVDLNRNYGLQWGRTVGSSSVVGTETYHGSAPFSEPETQAVRDLFAAHRFIGAISFHNYGQVVLTPWAYTYSPPRDGAAMRGLADEVAGEMNAAHDNPFNDYRSGQWASALYVGSGVFADWVYGTYGVMASLIELRPHDTPYFLLPADEILPTSVEAFAGSLHMIERVFGIHAGPPGDLNGNWLVENADTTTFNACLAGPDAAPPGFPLGCFGTDIVRDGHTDLLDMASFQNRFGSGPDSTPADQGD